MIIKIMSRTSHLISVHIFGDVIHFTNLNAIEQTEWHFECATNICGTHDFFIVLTCFSRTIPYFGQNINENAPIN